MSFWNRLNAAFSDLGISQHNPVQVYYKTNGHTYHYKKKCIKPADACLTADRADLAHMKVSASKSCDCKDRHSEYCLECPGLARSEHFLCLNISL